MSEDWQKEHTKKMCLYRSDLKAFVSRWYTLIRKQNMAEDVEKTYIKVGDRYKDSLEHQLRNAVNKLW